MTLAKPLLGGVSDSLLGTDFNGLKADAAKASQQQANLLAAMNNTAANANVDLSLSNIPDTEIGGTATAQATAATTKRKKTTAGGVATSLGINA